MATRSAIGVELEDGSVKAVYCHWDGYPEYNGRILRDYYSDRGKAIKLIDHGDISTLGPSIGSKHDFNERRESECTFYGRDRGEIGIDAKVYADPATYYKDFSMGGIEYFYLMMLDGTWTVREYGRHTWKAVDKVLKVREKANV